MNPIKHYSDPNQESQDDPRHKLLAEAGLLAELVKQHVADRQMARSQRQTTIYFIDAHELKIYLNASGNMDHLRGFALDVEHTLMAGDEQWRHLENYLRLKSEQMLHWLLFDYPHPVIILPSHSAELDDEIGYRSHQLLQNRLGLLQMAKGELRRLHSNVIGQQLLSQMLERAARSSEDRAALLGYLEQYAPAISALLRDDPDTMEKRIKELLHRSNVVSLKDAPWEHFGFDAPACNVLRTVSGDDNLSSRWQSFLTDHRSNSFQANRLDGEAIAQLTIFNRTLKQLGQPYHAVLVTRAMTLIGLIRRAKLDEDLRQQAWSLLRHSRLTIISPEDQSLSYNHSAVEEKIDEALGQLQVALSTYADHLSLPAEAKVDHAKEARSLVEAWHRFEAARYTVELAATRNAPAEAETERFNGEMLSKLLGWLRSEHELESAVVDRLNDTVASFNQKVFQDDDEGTDDVLKALVRPGIHHARLRVVPMSAHAIGPFEFEPSSFQGCFVNRPGSAASTVWIPLLTDNSRNIAEQYFVRALRQACVGKAQMASVYADGAFRSSQLLGNQPLTDEAVLLFAQSVRMDIATCRWDDPDMDRRIRRARDRLTKSASWHKDARFPLEASCLRLEALLRHSKWTDHQQQIDQGFDELTRAQNLPKASIEEIRIAECALLYLMNIVERSGSADSELGNTITAFHESLVANLDALRALDTEQKTEQEIEHLRPRVRGVEIAGYEFLKTKLPNGIHMDLHDLQGVLGKSSERSSKSVAVILQRMSSRMDGAREYNLAYAPIWSRSATEQFLGLDELHPQALKAAMQAVDIVYPIGDRYGLDTGIRESEQLAQANGLFLQALSRTSGIASTSPAKFHLLMEHYYCKLLASTLEKDADKRRDLLHSLGEEYHELLKHHPGSAIVHFRYSIVLGELDRHDESFSAVKQAMTCLAADSYISREHWISSTIVRRMAYHFARQAREVYERLKANPADQALSLQYRTHVREAFLTIFEGFDEQRSADNLLAALERQRRLNNIVYYASLYVRVDGDPRDLAPGFDEERLLGLVRKLHPHGISHVHAWNVLHTIGYAYHAMNRHDNASEAADALWNLIARIGTSTQSVGIRNALDDALVWKKHGAPLERATTV